ncbi:hypothetical protein ACFWNF_31920 [Streptomyces anulatus]|uniref:hypothetical protein n=1 Tax=Streptomyces anulatus TaxID=1892 RepID=UPI00364FE1F7
MESHGMYGVPRTEKGSASQIVGVVDTDRCNAAEVADARHRHVCACHCQQAAALVVDGEGWITNLGEGSVTEESIDAERSHGSDLLNGEKLREATGVQKLNSELDREVDDLADDVGQADRRSGLAGQFDDPVGGGMYQVTGLGLRAMRSSGDRCRALSARRCFGQVRVTGGRRGEW